MKKRLQAEQDKKLKASERSKLTPKSKSDITSPLRTEASPSKEGSVEDKDKNQTPMSGVTPRMESPERDSP